MLKCTICLASTDFREDATAVRTGSGRVGTADGCARGDDDDDDDDDEEEEEEEEEEDVDEVDDDDVMKEANLAQHKPNYCNSSSAPRKFSLNFLI
nr:unnamed protein product [Spirometra erinaceieuropaei]